MAKTNPTGKPEQLSPRARRLIARDPEAAAEIVMHVMAKKPGSIAKMRRLGKTGAFVSEKKAKWAGKTTIVQTLKRAGRPKQGPAEVTSIDAAPVSAPKPIPERLRRFTVPAADTGEFINASDAAQRLGVSRSTIYAWIEEGIVLGWRQTGPGLFIPAEQIRGERDVVPGLKELGDIVADPRLLWSFLSQPQPFEDEVRRPIELLASNRVDEVIGAAMAYGASPT